MVTLENTTFGEKSTDIPLQRFFAFPTATELDTPVTVVPKTCKPGARRASSPATDMTFGPPETLLMTTLETVTPPTPASTEIPAVGLSRASSKFDALVVGLWMSAMARFPSQICVPLTTEIPLRRKPRIVPLVTATVAALEMMIPARFPSLVAELVALIVKPLRLRSTSSATIAIGVMALVLVLDQTTSLVRV